MPTQTQLVRGNPLKPLARKVEFMRKRNIQIITRLNTDEYNHLIRIVNKSGLNKETYIRHLITDVVPTDAPSPDYFSMMKELRYIGVNLNQIAQKANILNAMDVQRYEENIAMLKAAILEITNAVMLPRKLERKTK